MRIRILSADDISKSVDLEEVIEVNAGAYRALSSNDAVQPQRVPIQTQMGTLLLMPAYLPMQNALAVKTVSIYPQNPGRELPTSQALVMVLDDQTGSPVALLDGTRLTALRTGAGSAAATDQLARQEAKSLAVLGAGGQAWDQIQAIAAIRGLETIRIFTPSRSSADSLAQRCSEAFETVSVSAVASAADAVTGADIVVCITTSQQPVFDAANIAPGTHINGVGSYLPAMREVPVTGYVASLAVFVDSMEAVLTEAGEIISGVKAGFLRREELVEIGHVLSGSSPGRSDSDQITFFKSVGVAAQDAATAQLVLRNAQAKGLGQEVVI